MSDDDPFFEALSDLCQDGSFDDAMETIYLIAKIDAGLKQVEAGEFVDEVEAWESMRSWLG